MSIGFTPPGVKNPDEPIGPRSNQRRIRLGVGQRSHVGTKREQAGHKQAGARDDEGSTGEHPDSLERRRPRGKTGYRRRCEEDDGDQNELDGDIPLAARSAPPGRLTRVLFRKLGFDSRACISRR